MFRLALATAALVFTGAVAPVQAQAPYVPPRVAKALQVAYVIWPGVCHPEVRFEAFTDRSGQAVLGGKPCTMWLDVRWRHIPWEMLCSIVVHEVGHLAGHRHSLNPRSVMHTPILVPNKRCRR